MIYGKLPDDLGLIDLSPTEMMLYQYLPVSTPGMNGWHISENLRQFWPILEKVRISEGAVKWYDRYVYLTVKNMWVSGDYVGNRPGWHSDGFGTDDVNYIWYDREPTEFLEDSFTLLDDCPNAMQVMEDRARGEGGGPAYSATYPDKHLLRLTPEVIHRTKPFVKPGMRCFVKVSVSRDRYNLLGNSINHGLAERWDMQPRELERNHPHKK